jgi:Cu/Ag efflux pump CusA
VPDRVVGINSGEIWVSLDPAADYAATVNRVNNVAALYPGLAQGVVTYPSSRVDEIVATPQPDAYVRIYGRTTEQLQVQAASVQQAVAGVPGVGAATVEPLIFEDTIEIEVNLTTAAAAGLKPGDVRRSAAALLSGFEVGALFEEQKVFDVVVWGVPEIRASAAAVSQLLVDTPSGVLVPLGQVAQVRTIPRLSEIHREGVMRKLDVQIDLAGGDTAATLRGIDAALGSVAFPLEYHAEVFSPQLAREGALMTLALATVAAALGILLLLQAALGSWRLALMFLLMLPVALIGSVLAALFLGGITIAAVGGLLTVLAITARNAITSADHFQRALLANGEAEREILVRVARERLAPIVLTALATAAAVVPFAVLGARPGYEILGPTAIVVLAGLVTSTLANLFVVPMLFRQVGPSQEAETAAEPAPTFRDRRVATPA